jgi:GNAT superfamily N-acetyltransferase
VASAATRSTNAGASLGPSAHVHPQPAGVEQAVSCVAEGARRAPDPLDGIHRPDRPDCPLNPSGAPLSMASVRRIEPGEGEVLRELRLAALADTPSAFSSLYAEEASRTSAEWTELAQLGADGFDRSTFLAFDEGGAVGIVGGYRPDPGSQFVELVSMWTLPSARRGGVGRALIDALFRWAGESGAEAVRIWVTEGNDPALNLYSAAGFVQIEGREPLRPGSNEQVARMEFVLP